MAVASTVAAMGATMSRVNPILAANLAMPNGFAEMRVANALTVPAIAASGTSEPDSLSSDSLAYARRALVHEPTSSEAASILALDPKLPKEQRRALMHSAQQLSRRNNYAIAWLVEDRARSGDIEGMIRQYDLGMRRGGAIAGRLSGNLVGVMANPDAVPLLHTILATNPDWAGRFWARLPLDQNALINGAKLRVSLANTKLDKAEYQDAALIGGLVAKGAVREAAELYHVLAPSARSNDELVSNSEFDGTGAYPPFDWLIQRAGTYSASIDTSRGLLTLAASDATNPVFARQVVELPTGSFRFSLEKHETDPSVSLPVRLRLTCVDPAVAMPPREFDFSRSSSFTLSLANSSCTFFWLDVVGSRDGANSFDQLQIDRISIRKLEN